MRVNIRECPEMPLYFACVAFFDVLPTTTKAMARYSLTTKINGQIVWRCASVCSWLCLCRCVGCMAHTSVNGAVPSALFVVSVLPSVVLDAVGNGRNATNLRVYGVMC